MGENPLKPIDRLSESERQAFQHFYCRGQLFLMQAMKVLHPDFSDDEYAEQCAPLVSGIVDRWLFTGNVEWDSLASKVSSISKNSSKKALNAIKYGGGGGDGAEIK